MAPTRKQLQGTYAQPSVVIFPIIEANKPGKVSARRARRRRGERARQQPACAIFLPRQNRTVMSTILILYATTEGQTARIAERITRTLRNEGHEAESYPADQAGRGWGRRNTTCERLARRFTMAASRLCFVAGTRQSLMRCARPQRGFFGKPSAGGPGAKPYAARRYLEIHSLRQTGWQPPQAATSAGATPVQQHARRRG
jgi:hypothetical protein